MIQLSDLHEGSLLYNLKTRYENSKIYTYTVRPSLPPSPAFALLASILVPLPCLFFLIACTDVPFFILAVFCSDTLLLVFVHSLVLKLACVFFHSLLLT